MDLLQLLWKFVETRLGNSVAIVVAAALLWWVLKVINKVAEDWLAGWIRQRLSRRRPPAPARARAKPAVRAETPDLTGFELGELTAAFHVILGNGEETFGLRDLTCSSDDTPVPLPDEVLARKDELVEALRARRPEAELFDAPGVKLHSFSPNTAFVSGKERQRPHFHFKPTTYTDFVATNLSAEKPIWTDDHGRRVNLIAKFKVDPLEFHRSFLSNRLGAGMLILSSDNKALLVRRSSLSLVAPNTWHISVGEGMNWNDDRLDGHPHPFVTLQRGAREELGLEVPLESIRLLVFGIYLPALQPTVLGLARVKEPASRLMARYSSGGGKDRWENRAVMVEDFTVENMYRLLHEFTWTPTATVAIITALIHLYGRDAVEEAFHVTSASCH